jgi:hypothetical protein
VQAIDHASVIVRLAPFFTNRVFVDPGSPRWPRGVLDIAALQFDTSIGPCAWTTGPARRARSEKLRASAAGATFGGLL